MVTSRIAWLCSSETLKARERLEIRVSDIERSCRNYRDSLVAHSARHSSRSRTE